MTSFFDWKYSKKSLCTYKAYLHWLCYISAQRGSHFLQLCFPESQTIEDFGAALHLMRSDLEHLRSVFMAVENGDLGMLKSLGIKDSELGDVKFFLEKLVNTGFLDWIAPESASDYYIVQFAPLSSSFYSYLPYDSTKYRRK